jgi:hypothetical protein
MMGMPEQRAWNAYMAHIKKSAPPGIMELYHNVLMRKDEIIQARQASRMNAKHSSKSLDSIRADLFSLETQIVLLEADMLLWRLGK